MIWHNCRKQPVGVLSKDSCHYAAPVLTADLEKMVHSLHVYSSSSARCLWSWLSFAGDSCFVFYLNTGVQWGERWEHVVCPGNTSLTADDMVKTVTQSDCRTCLYDSLCSHVSLMVFVPATTLKVIKSVTCHVLYGPVNNHTSSQIDQIMSTYLVQIESPLRPPGQFPWTWLPSILSSIYIELMSWKRDRSKLFIKNLELLKNYEE